MNNSHSRNMIAQMRRKQCAAFSLITLLVFASFSRPLFLSPESTVSYRKLIRYCVYITTIALGCLYIWKRLVADVEANSILKYENSFLPLSLKNDDQQKTGKIEIIDSKFSHTSQNRILKIWKFFIISSLFVVILGYVRLHSHRRNTFFSQFDNFCFTLLGSGAFLAFSLFILDCILLGIFGCQIFILLFGTKSVADRDQSLYGNSLDHVILKDVFNFFTEPRKSYHHWRKFADEIISPLWRTVLVVLITFGVTLYGLNRAHRTLDVNKLSIPVRMLPTSLKDLSIVQVCDFHIGPWLWTDHVSRVVNRVNDLDADIIVIVGDLVDLKLDLVSDALEPLRHLKAKRGIYFVAGNHDYYLGDVDSLISYLEDIGVIILNNQNDRICAGESTSNDCFYLIGTEDISQGEAAEEESGHSFQLDEAMDGVDPKMPAVLLTHQPLGAKKAISSGYRFDLILSGHTHGGQFFPVSLIVYLSVPYFHGLYHVREDTYLYVSNGVGFWGIPMRFMAPPEVAVLSLVSDQRTVDVQPGEDNVSTRET